MTDFTEHQQLIITTALSLAGYVLMKEEKCEPIVQATVLKIVEQIRLSDVYEITVQRLKNMKSEEISDEDIEKAINDIAWMKPNKETK